MPRFSADERGLAMGLIEAGVPVANVANLLTIVGKSSIDKVQENKKDKRPTKIRDATGYHPAQDRFIRVTHLRLIDSAPVHRAWET
ncbi:hypothetical protein PoB_007090500 [Plakobranchus ocellatus]|uniref:Paired domain-containing protein n=1 Tax=Plakobranchus ocellatus TaxID=259542 RepID=A0AAV4DK61_9GAST|nr:hypothetical protein PoB_007090500 [Plakobranchus ocellatus]